MSMLFKKIMIITLVSYVVKVKSEHSEYENNLRLEIIDHTFCLHPSSLSSTEIEQFFTCSVLTTEVCIILSKLLITN